MISVAFVPRRARAARFGTGAATTATAIVIKTGHRHVHWTPTAITTDVNRTTAGGNRNRLRARVRAWSAT